MLLNLIFMILSALIAVLFGMAWELLNIESNLYVVDVHVAANSPMHPALSWSLVSLSLGLFMLHLSVRFNREKKDKDGNVIEKDPPTPYMARPLVISFVVGSTLADTIIPAYGGMLMNQWAWTMQNAIISLLVHGVFGSIIAQSIATEAAIYSLLCGKKLWSQVWAVLTQARESAPSKPRVLPPTNRATVGTPPIEMRRRMPESPPPSDDLEFSKVG